MVLLKLQEKVQCVRGERKLNFGNETTEILVLLVLPSLPVKCPKCMLGGVPEMETNYGNDIVENGRKKKKKKRIVATKLPKMEGKKKKSYVYNIFHNKLQVVSCYWFKFEPNTKIIFFPQ